MEWYRVDAGKWWEYSAYGKRNSFGVDAVGVEYSE